MSRLRVAVVGSGVAGLTAAHILARTHEVTLFERDDRLGGHANTIAVRAADGREVALDTGFIVHNQRTYPTLLRLFSGSTRAGKGGRRRYKAGRDPHTGERHVVRRAL